jgi:chromate transport protein ChrA
MHGMPLMNHEIATENTPPHPVRFMQAVSFWLKLGFISFGGPAGQIAIMHCPSSNGLRQLG